MTFCAPCDQVLTFANSVDNPSQTPLSHLKGRTILTKTDAVDRIEGLQVSLQEKKKKNSFFEFVETQHLFSNIPESYGNQLLVHREESKYWSVLRITRVSSAHRQMDRNLPDSLLFRNGQ